MSKTQNADSDSISHVQETLEDIDVAKIPPDFEEMVLTNLVFRPEYQSKVMPYVSRSLFKDDSQKIIFQIVSEFVKKYNATPTPEAILLGLETNKASQRTIDSATELLERIVSRRKNSLSTSLQFLVDSSEQWIRERSTYNVLAKAIEWSGDPAEAHRISEIPALLTDAVSISFKKEVGHDFFRDASKRWEKMHDLTFRTKSELSCLNYVTKGGFKQKTLNILIGGTNVGKTLGLIDFTGQFLRQGEDVLYVTAEMSEEDIAARLEANVLEVPTYEIEKMDKMPYLSLVERAQNKIGKGRLIIKEFPTGQCTVEDIDRLIVQLKNEEGFTPKVLMVDYLGIMSSKHVKDRSNLYSMGKAVAEGVRGLAIQHNLIAFSASQFNRTGMDNTGASLSQISDSVAIAFTADLALALIRTPELDALKQMSITVLKNRYRPIGELSQFNIGLNLSLQKFFDADLPPKEGASSGKQSFGAHVSSGAVKKELDGMPPSLRGANKTDFTALVTGNINGFSV